MVCHPLVGGGGEDTRRPTAISSSRRPLTQRECDVLIGIANGLSDKEIAVRLFVSKSTVKTHLKILSIGVFAYATARRRPFLRTPRVYLALSSTLKVSLVAAIQMAEEGALIRRIRRG